MKFSGNQSFEGLGVAPKELLSSVNVLLLYQIERSNPENRIISGCISCREKHRDIR